MGAGANNSGNKALNEKAERAAGRQDDRGPTREAILDAAGVDPGRPVDGAFGKDGHANRHPGNVVGEGGGGGGATPTSDIMDVNPSHKPARKRS
jgi:hypothetical protein